MNRPGEAEMKCEMVYGVYKYGNESNAAEYSVKFAREKGRKLISITFEFKQPAGGRGVGDSKGKVESVALHVPPGTAHALSHALQLALADTASTAVEFEISEGSGVLESRVTSN